MDRSVPGRRVRSSSQHPAAAAGRAAALVADLASRGGQPLTAQPTHRAGRVKRGRIHRGRSAADTGGGGYTRHRLFASSRTWSSTTRAIGSGLWVPTRSRSAAAADDPGGHDLRQLRDIATDELGVALAGSRTTNFAVGSG